MKRLVLALMLCLLLPIPCSAASDGLLEEGLSRFGTEALEREVPEQARRLAEQAGLGGLTFGDMLRLTPGEFYAALKISLGRAVGEARASLFSIIGAVLLCAALSCLDQKGSAASPVFETVAVLTVTASLSAPVVDCVREASSSIVDASLFMLSYVPLYSTVITASGQPVSAAGYSLSVMAAAQLTGQLAAQVMIPLCGVYLALCLAGGIGKNPGISSLAAGIKKLVVWSLTLAMTVFVGVLTLQSFMSSAADGVAVKTTKFLVGSFVPVVGGAISDALAAAQGSLRLIKATVGSFGIAVAALTFLPALARVTVLRAVVAVAAAAGETLGVTQLKGILGGFGSVLTVLTAMLMSMGLLMIISTAVMLSAGGGALG